MSKRAPRPRPRFELRSPHPPDEVIARVRAALEADRGLVGVALPSGRVELTVAPEAQRAWSPELAANVRPDGDGSRLHARFGPHANVWTLYVMLYGVSVLVAVGLLVYGAAQWTLGETPWAFYASPAAALLAALVFGAAYVGQGLGSEQMYRLRAFLEKAAEADG